MPNRDGPTGIAAPRGLLELYRAAQRLEAAPFAAHAFEWLRSHLAFERGVILTTFEKHVAWVDAHVFGVDDPRALMASHARVRHLDVLSARLVTRPMVAQRQDGDDPEIAGEQFAPLREHLRTYGGWYAVCLMVPSAEHHTSTVTMLCRDERARRFSKTDVARLEALGPHVAEAAAVNRAIWLPRSVAGALPVALLDADGRFSQTTDAFVRLFWPNAPPTTAYVDEDVMRSLRKRRRWLLPGGAHTLYGEPEVTGGWRLRIRPTSAAALLSARERQVATLFSQGASYRSIAEKLGVAPATARNHLQTIYAKLRVSTRAELTAVMSEE